MVSELQNHKPEVVWINIFNEEYKKKDKRLVAITPIKMYHPGSILFLIKFN